MVLALLEILGSYCKIYLLDTPTNKGEINYLYRYLTVILQICYDMLINELILYYKTCLQVL